ncbi:hypothetical protein MGLY_10320 [Neomoorella glycerini]|uniref:Regulatory protein GemA n=1 Tax=Neomoorella glycerini TaxID=55779 RepID=A0A6I5ZP37_9FIRM|nr:regulatory protein GemA [Moorella glycerini]QGP91690.1 hypothetical protein MGLY_10320 [Moorella glycerini]
MAKISKGQNAKIWAMARQLDLDSDLLHEFVYNYTGEKSIAALSRSQAAKVIDVMESRLGSRPANRVSKKQLWKIRQLARQLGWDDNPKRLQGFVKKYGGVDKPEWLSPAQAWKVIEGLKKLAERTENGG